MKKTLRKVLGIGSVVALCLGATACAEPGTGTNAVPAPEHKVSTTTHAKFD